MAKRWFMLIVPVAVLVLLSSCFIFGKPDYVGTWNATVGTTPIVLVFEKDTFEITVGTAAAGTVVSGDVAESNGVLTVTITSMTQAGVQVPAANLAATLAGMGLTAAETVTYSVAADAMTVSGTLIGVLTGGATTSVTGTKA